MPELLSKAMAAHGGLDRWRKVRRVSASFSPSGLSLHQRGPVGDAVTRLPMRVNVDTRRMETVFEPFVTPRQRGIYRPSRTSVEMLDGTPVESLDDPREALKSMGPGTPWSAPQVLYFLGYSLWMYVTLPFSLTTEGVVCEEVEPLKSDGEVWRALKVSYPTSYHSHSAEQIHYFDERGLMRRQDYTVDVRQSLSTAHYMSEPQIVDGFVFPTKRRVYLRGPDGAPLLDRLVIAADLGDFNVVTGSV